MKDAIITAQEFMNFVGQVQLAVLKYDDMDDILQEIIYEAKYVSKEKNK